MEQTKLFSLQTADIEKIEKEKLTDITKVDISQNEPPAQRLIKFMYSMENPYVFRVDKTPVKVMFSKRHNAESLQKCMENIVNNKMK